MDGVNNLDLYTVIIDTKDAEGQAFREIMFFDGEDASDVLHQLSQDLVLDADDTVVRIVIRPREATDYSAG